MRSVGACEDMFSDMSWVWDMSHSSLVFCFFFFFQAEDGIRDLVRSRGLGDVYKRQGHMVTELLPDIRCDKGTALCAFADRLGVPRSAVLLSLIHI